MSTWLLVLAVCCVALGRPAFAAPIAVDVGHDGIVHEHLRTVHPKRFEEAPIGGEHTGPAMMRVWASSVQSAALGDLSCWASLSGIVRATRCALECQKIRTAFCKVPPDPNATLNVVKGCGECWVKYVELCEPEAAAAIRDAEVVLGVAVQTLDTGKAEEVLDYAGKVLDELKHGEEIMNCVTICADKTAMCNAKVTEAEAVIKGQFTDCASCWIDFPGSIGIAEVDTDEIKSQVGKIIANLGSGKNIGKAKNFFKKAKVIKDKVIKRLGTFSKGLTTNWQQLAKKMRGGRPAKKMQGYR